MYTSYINHIYHVHIYILDYIYVNIYVCIPNYNKSRREVIYKEILHNMYFSMQLFYHDSTRKYNKRANAYTFM